MAKHVAVFQQATAQSPLGEQVEINFKAAVFNEGPVYWELRRIFIVLCEGSRKTLRLHKIIHQNKASWDTTWQHFGLNPADVLKPSLRAAMARSQDDVNDPYVSGEFTVSTAGLLTLLLNQAATRHKVAERDVAEGMLRAWLLKCGSSAVLAEDAIRGAWGRFKHLCTLAPRTNDRCPCSNHFFGVDLDRTLLRMSWATFTSMMVRAVPMMELPGVGCDVVRHVTQAWVQALVTHIENVLRLSEAGDILKQPPLKFGSQQRSLRIDEDYKQSVVVDLVKSGKAHCGWSTLRAHGDCDASCATWWEADRLGGYHAAVQRQFHDSMTISVTQDGKRRGNPAEDYVLYQLWDAKKELGCHLAPQEKLT